MDRTIEGVFYKTGSFFKGFRKRAFSLKWLDSKLHYGTGKKFFDLTKVTHVSLALDENYISHKKHGLSLDDTMLYVPGGVLSLTFGGNLFAGTRRFTMPDKEKDAEDVVKFHTFAYWLIAAVEHNSKARFAASNKLLDKLDIPKHQALENRNARSAILFARIERELGKRDDGDNKTKVDKNKIQARLGKQFKFKEDDQLGEGSFGVVYKGERSNQDEPVAVKYISYDRIAEKQQKSKTDANQDALREASALAILHEKSVHPNILKLYDVLQVKDGLCIFTEICSTKSTDWANDHLNPERCQSESLRVANAKLVVGGVLDAFERIHDCKLVHFDIKDDNLLFSGDKERGFVPKVIDLGLAMPLLDDKLENINVAAKDRVGTPTYRTPEQLAASYAENEEGIGWGLTFEVFEKIDSYKVGLFLLRLLSRAWLSDKAWSAVYKGTLLTADGTPLKPFAELEYSDFMSTENLKNNVLGLKKQVESLENSSVMRMLCETLLPLVKFKTESRATVRDVRKEFNRLFFKKRSVGIVRN